MVINGHHVKPFDVENIQRLKLNLNKYRKLAFDAQAQLEASKDSQQKQQTIIKQLKMRLEDSELAKTNALKSKHQLQNDVNDLQAQIEQLAMSKQYADDQYQRLLNEFNELKAQIDDNERDLADCFKKYQVNYQNYFIDSKNVIDLNNQIDVLGNENRLLKYKLKEYENRIDVYETTWCDRLLLSQNELKVKEMETKLDLELTLKSHLQVQYDRIKQLYESRLAEFDACLSKEKKYEDSLKRLQRTNKDLNEEFVDIRKKLIDADEYKKRLVSAFFPMKTKIPAEKRCFTLKNLAIIMVNQLEVSRLIWKIDFAHFLFK
jgi:myosin-18